VSRGILSITKFQLTLRLVVLADYRGRHWTIPVPFDFHNHVGCGVWSSGEYIVKLREAIYDVIPRLLSSSSEENSSLLDGWWFISFRGLTYSRSNT
jgi:hypothetical protein